MSTISAGLGLIALDYVKFAEQHLYEKLIIEFELVEWINNLVIAGSIMSAGRVYGWTDYNTYTLDYRPSDDPHLSYRIEMVFAHLPVGSGSATTKSPNDAYDRAMKGI